MPAPVRMIDDMFTKYSVKYDGKNVTTTWTAVRDLMTARFQAGFSTTIGAVERIKTLLANRGVPPTDYAVYLSFALKLASKTFSHVGGSLAIMASALKQQWITAHGADPSILDAIIREITGVTAPY